MNWTALSAISTLLACIIAIVMPFILHKIEHNRQLNILANSQLYCDADNNTTTKTFSIQITNLSNMPIEIKQISIIINKTAYAQKSFIQNMSNFSDIFAYGCNKLPITIDIGNRIIYNFSLDELKENFEQAHELDKLNKPITILIVDTLNKKYTLRTHHTLSHYIDKLYK